jgi:UPF0755 protein
MKKITLIILSVFFLLLLGASLFFYQGVFLPKEKLGEDYFFIVKKGEGLSAIASNLKQENIIKEDYFFVFYGRVTGKGTSLKPGNYKLSSSMSVKEIVEKMVRGGSERFVIIEGWNLRDIATALKEAGYIEEKENFYAVTGKPPFYDGENIQEHKARNMENKFDFLTDIPQDLSLEGFLFPDTYSISPGTAIEDIIFSFLFNFEDKITPEIETMIDKRGLSLFETVTIASLIEKEVVTYEDKRIVSGIIQKRLENEMRLQIDATISYLTGRRSVQIPITETRIDSPYNTYFYSGLPKGPISNPGIESIKAALDPEKTDYLFYLSKPTGETVFSRTHEEHVEAKHKYLQ